jgi:hypothetical protein
VLDEPELRNDNVDLIFNAIDELIVEEIPERQGSCMRVYCIENGP